MIFIWTNNEGGGPLQYAGLFLFALQFLLPQVMDVYNLTMEIEHAHKIPLAAVTCAFLLVVTAIIIWVVFDWEWNTSNENADGHSATAATTTTTTSSSSSAPAGSATNPVIIDDDENETSTNNNSNANSSNDSRNRSLQDRARAIMGSLSPLQVMIAAGIILPLAMIIPIVLDGGATALFNERNTLQLSMFAFLAHSFMAVGAYRILRGILNGDVGTYPGMRGAAAGGMRARRSRKYTVEDIAELVRKVPVEEFVSEEELKSGGCSISKMKRMLVNRGASDALHKCLDRNDLLQEIER
ncbi:hypothetical protein ACHAWC_006688, partial [Mediolabrus comicus]